MQKLECAQQAGHHDLRLLLGVFSIFDNVFEQISPAHNFHDEMNAVCSLPAVRPGGVNTMKKGWGEDQALAQGEPEEEGGKEGKKDMGKKEKEENCSPCSKLT